MELSFPLRTLSFNAFLCSKQISGNPAFRNCCYQEERALAIAEFCCDFDVIALQEVFIERLPRALKELAGDDLDIPDMRRSWFAGLGMGSLFGSASSSNKEPAGLWSTHRRDLNALDKRFLEYPQQDGFGVSLGACATLLDVRAAWPGCFLVVVNTQLSTNKLRRRSQLLALQGFVLGLRRDWAPALRARNATWSNCGFVLLGDLALPAGSDEYAWLLEALNAVDFHVEPSSPRTPHTHEPSINSLAATCRAHAASEPDRTSPGESQSISGATVGRRVDYALWLRGAPDGTQFLRLYAANYAIWKRTVMSDHWPVVIDIAPALPPKPPLTPPSPHTTSPILPFTPSKTITDALVNKALEVLRGYPSPPPLHPHPHPHTTLYKPKPQPQLVTNLSDVSRDHNESSRSRPAVIGRPSSTMATIPSKPHMDGVATKALELLRRPAPLHHPHHPQHHHHPAVPPQEALAQHEAQQREERPRAEQHRQQDQHAHWPSCACTCIHARSPSGPNAPTSIPVPSAGPVAGVVSVGAGVRSAVGSPSTPVSPWTRTTDPGTNSPHTPTTLVGAADPVPQTTLSLSSIRGPTPLILSLGIRLGRSRSRRVRALSLAAIPEGDERFAAAARCASQSRSPSRSGSRSPQGERRGQTSETGRSASPHTREPPRQPCRSAGPSEMSEASGVAADPASSKSESRQDDPAARLDRGHNVSSAASPRSALLVRSPCISGDPASRILDFGNFDDLEHAPVGASPSQSESETEGLRSVSRPPMSPSGSGSSSGTGSSSGSGSVSVSVSESECVSDGEHGRGVKYAGEPRTPRAPVRRLLRNGRSRSRSVTRSSSRGKRGSGKAGKAAMAHAATQTQTQTSHAGPEANAGEVQHVGVGVGAETGRESNGGAMAGGVTAVIEAESIPKPLPLTALIPHHQLPDLLVHPASSDSDSDLPRAPGPSALPEPASKCPVTQEGSGKLVASRVWQAEFEPVAVPLTDLLPWIADEEPLVILTTDRRVDEPMHLHTPTPPSAAVGGKVADAHQGSEAGLGKPSSGSHRGRGMESTGADGGAGVGGTGKAANVHGKSDVTDREALVARPRGRKAWLRRTRGSVDEESVRAAVARLKVSVWGRAGVKLGVGVGVGDEVGRGDREPGVERSGSESDSGPEGEGLLTGGDCSVVTVLSEPGAEYVARAVVVASESESRATVDLTAHVTDLAYFARDRPGCESDAESDPFPDCPSPAATSVRSALSMAGGNLTRCSFRRA